MHLKNSQKQISPAVINEMVSIKIYFKSGI